MPSNIEHLDQIAQQFVRDSDHLGQVYQTAMAYYNLLAKITNLDIEETGNRQETITEFGKSISLFSAAFCVRDFMRTQAFIKALYLGIIDMKARFPGQTIEILYAGTGPFAAIALPMRCFFSPEDIQFTLLELNPDTANALAVTVKAFDFEPFIKETIIQDALKYSPEPNQSFHILLSETMQPALKTEPQVAITLHLSPFVRPNGILIPQQIRVYPALLDTKLENESMNNGKDILPTDYILPLQDIFTLELGQTFPKQLPATTTAPIAFPEIVVTLPEALDARFTFLMICTALQVYGPVYLYPKQTTITLNMRLWDLRVQAIHQAGFQYICNKQPGFISRIIH